MKITFEGETIQSIMEDIEDMADLFRAGQGRNKPEPQKLPEVDLAAVEENLRAPWPTQGPGPQGPKVIPEVNPTNASATKKPRTPKQLENDERLRQAALAKIEAKKAAKAEKDAGVVQPVRPTPPKEVPPPATAESLGLDAAEVVNVRNKTITDLQEAYANGFQKEVFELLSRFGNGAKSFRELPPESFVPIREAIDNGALT